MQTYLEKRDAAMTAGLDHALGAAVIPIDVDLQDPPKLIVEFVRLWCDGFDVVFGQRVERSSDTGIKRMTAGLFYQVFNTLASRPIDENAGDYRLMTRRVVKDLRLLRERNRFMKGLFSWVGYKSAAVPYERPVRVAGETKFNYWKLWNFALDGLTSFSTVPLRIWTYIGGSVAAAALVYTIILMALIVPVLHFPYYVGFAVVTFLVPLGTFLANKFWVFTHRSTE